MKPSDAKIIVTELLALYGVRAPTRLERLRWWNKLKARTRARARRALGLARTYTPATWAELKDIREKPGDRIDLSKIRRR